MYSVLFRALAAGNQSWNVPSFTVYKSLNWYEEWTKWCIIWLLKVGVDARHSVWILDGTLCQKCRTPRKTLYFSMFNGHGSHLTYKTVKIAKDNRIIILCLPPNTSHALQQLGVCPCEACLENNPEGVVQWGPPSKSI